MSFLPLRLRPLGGGDILCAADGGGFFKSNVAFARRLADDMLSEADSAYLAARGHLIDDCDTLAQTSYQYNVANRLDIAGDLDYLILVPTLRCNLSCSYCQVSRAAEQARGFDWSMEIEKAVINRLKTLPSTRVKIEFQGGEPTLRPDILRRVMAACDHIPEAEFVICTNLMNVTAEIWALFDDRRVYISTSLDGPREVHQRNRTENNQQTLAFETNFEEVIRRYGPGKISALPTINPKAPPDIDALIDTYLSYGQRQIFLRPINFHGFARKQHRESIELSTLWQDYYERFVKRMIERNFAHKEHILEETYLSIALRRIFQPGIDRHVDLRSPSAIGRDYVVIDYDGIAYPTDEARMLARSGVIDLSIGDIFGGWDTKERTLLDSHASNQFDPDCQRCTYQPYCGRDVVDDLARYGRIDMPRLETAFCKRHQSLFDFIFKLLYDDSEAVRYSLARWLRIPGDFAKQEVWL